MKIGYIINQNSCISGLSNGVRMQAIIWKDGLERLGHKVVLIDAWGAYDWRTFDIIHCFSYGDSISFVGQLKQRGCKIVVSPIIDSSKNIFLYKCYTYLGFPNLRLFSAANNLRRLNTYVDGVLVRSNHEYEYVHDCYGFAEDKINIIPLSYRCEAESVDMTKKENFCLHVSSITQGRKNVMRLIEAAEKYGFELVLAGNSGDAVSFAPFKNIIERNPNIKYLGFVSEEQLRTLYRRAKVFALPSFDEGVGLVALEAAVFGCDIVITDIGGPKEYYNGLAYTVNPWSVDDIGEKVLKALRKSHQPALRNHIVENYSVGRCCGMLESFYLNL